MVSPAIKDLSLPFLSLKKSTTLAADFSFDGDLPG